MTRYAQNGGLTRFDTGGTHEQSPISGIPIGNNNSVEQGESKSGNFVYSNRIFLDSNIVSQYNLPKSLIGKSVADATKFIDNKFKGRNDKISQSTKNGMLSKIAEAQESMKPQEPEMEQSSEGMIDPSQMALGGYVKPFNYGGSTSTPQYDQYGNVIPPTTTDALQAGLSDFSSTLKSQSNSEDSEDPDSETKNKVADYLQAGVTAIDLGKTAFGKPTQDTSGLAPSAKVNSGGMIAGSAMKGASAGMAFGPAGAGIGAAIGGVAGLLGSNKAKKAAIENTNNYAVNVNKQFSDQYAMGGEIDPPTKITKNDLINLSVNTSTKHSPQLDRFRYAIGEQSGVQHGMSGEQGYYLYYGKKPGDAGFNANINREFVNQSGYDTYMRSPQGQQYRRNLSTKSIQPIEQFTDISKVKKMAYGGKMNKMFDGGDYYENLILTNDNRDPNYSGFDIANAKRLPIKSIMETSGLKPVNATTPYTIGTQPKVDISNANRQFTSGPSFGRQVWEGTKDTGKFINNNAGNIARYAPIAANALQLAQLKKPQGERLDRLSNRYKPEYVDEASLQNIADQTMNNSVNAIGQSGASQGQLRSSIIGSQLQRTKAISDAYSQAAAQNRATNDRAQTFNLGVDQVNLQQSNTEKDINARNQGAYDTEKSKLIGKIGENIGNVGTEQAYKKIAITTTGYNWLAEYQKANPTATAEEAVTAAKKAGVIVDDTKTTKKNALGGYLIKNKVK